MRKYKSFCVAANDGPADTCIALNKKIDSLLSSGWMIDHIDCHDNIFDVWKGDKKKYYTTKDYIILAYVDNKSEP